MKKIVFILAAMTGFIFTSCSNDDIKIETKEHIPEYDLSLKVSVESVYDEFGVKDEFGTKYLSGNYSIGLFCYIYDAEGNAVDSLKSTTKNYNQVSLEVKQLLRGTYTVATIETIVNSAGQSPHWNIVNSDKLSTLAIMQKQGDTKVERKSISEEGLLGISTNTINLNSEIEQAIKPTAIGALAQVYYVDFDKSDYLMGFVTTKDSPNGYYLNPALSASEHFIKSYNSENIWSIRSMATLSKSESEVSENVYILDQGSHECLVGASLSKDPDENGNYTGHASSYIEKPIVIEKGKTYYIGVAYTGTLLSGTWTTSFDDLRTWYQSIDNTMLGFKEPSFDWDATVSAVKTYMSGYTLSQDIYYNENWGYIMCYSGKSPVYRYYYCFKEKTKGLYETMVYVDKTKATLDDIFNYYYYTKLYEYVGPGTFSDGGTYYQFAPDDNTVLYFYESDSYIIIDYYDWNYTYQPQTTKVYLYGGPDNPEQTPFVPGAWDAAAMRFSSTEGKYLPTIPDDVYFGLKTLIFDVSDVSDDFDLKVMNGWWSNTYYDHVKWTSGLNELQITDVMAVECAKGGEGRDLDLMLYSGSCTINAVYYEESEHAYARSTQKTNARSKTRNRPMPVMIDRTIK